jgi:hypothetical protein
MMVAGVRREVWLWSRRKKYSKSSREIALMAVNEL